MSRKLKHSESQPLLTFESKSKKSSEISFSAIQNDKKKTYKSPDPRLSNQLNKSIMKLRTSKCKINN